MRSLLVFKSALARPRKRVPRPRLALLPASAVGSRGRSVTGSGYVRAVLPYTQEALTSRFDVATSTDGALPAPGSAEIVLLQRDLVEEAWSGFEAWRQRFRQAGGRMIYEIDDDLMDAEALTARGYARDPRALAERVRVYASAADVITVSTPELAKRLSPWGKKVRVVPNAIDERLWDVSRRARAGHARPKGPGQVRIGYMGTHTHYDDMRLVQEAIHRVQDRYGAGVDVEVIGVFQRRSPLFGTRLPLPRRHDYPAFVRWVQDVADWDVAMIPLAHDPFNLAKSDLKFIESAALRTAIACSDVPTYRAVARHGENCLIVPNTTEGWVEALGRLIEDPPLRRRLAEEAYREASHLTVQRRVDLYTSVLDAVLQLP